MCREGLCLQQEAFQVADLFDASGGEVLGKRNYNKISFFGEEK